MYAIRSYYVRADALEHLQKLHVGGSLATAFVAERLDDVGLQFGEGVQTGQEFVQRILDLDLVSAHQLLLADDVDLDSAKHLSHASDGLMLVEVDLRLSYAGPNLFGRIERCSHVTPRQTSCREKIASRKPVITSYSIHYTKLYEALQLIKLLWTQEKVNFAGQYYQVQDLKVEPRPISVPHQGLKEIPAFQQDVEMRDTGRLEPLPRRRIAIGTEGRLGRLGNAPQARNNFV